MVVTSTNTGSSGIHCLVGRSSTTTRKKPTCSWSRTATAASNATVSGNIQYARLE